MTKSQEEIEFLKGLRQEFLEKVTQDLDTCEQQILEFEKKGDATILQAFSRLIHSIKGSARAVDMPEMGEILHRLEDHSAALSKGTQSNPQVFVDLALKTMDGLRAYAQAALSGAEDPSVLSQMLQNWPQA